MVAEDISISRACPRCHAGVPRLYGLPDKVLLSRAAPRAACYFCYVRIVGIKPTRTRLLQSLLPAVSSSEKEPRRSTTSGYRPEALRKYCLGPRQNLPVVELVIVVLPMGEQERSGD
jgi:hypothetical protein